MIDTGTIKGAMKYWVSGIPATDGAGVKLTRMIGTPELEMVGPFLMLDHMNTDDPDSYIAGFPAHPHRGFETVTLIREGLMRHRDSKGNSGVLQPGDIQWMTAGRGIIHSEMPEMVEGRLSGFQLWVNLPSHLKMIEPSYQEISSKHIPSVSLSAGKIRVIAGNYQNIIGPAVPKIEARLLELTLKPNTLWDIEPQRDAEFFICIYEGSIKVNDINKHIKEILAPAVVLFEKDKTIGIKTGNKGANFLYCEGEAIDEPVARMGPFVMNSKEELLEAAEDYRFGRLVT